jgi:hypothetical protein
MSLLKPVVAMPDILRQLLKVWLIQFGQPATSKSRHENAVGLQVKSRRCETEANIPLDASRHPHDMSPAIADLSPGIIR